jgi:tRNA uridine 5-carboxymethylaminomethyl modification enzyme
VLRRPDVHFDQVADVLAGVTPAIGQRLETQIKMAGYVGRQEAAIARAAADESSVVPDGFDYKAVAALSLEARDKLSRVRPRTLGAAGRVPGITPADLAVLSVVLHRRAETRIPVAAG